MTAAIRAENFYAGILDADYGTAETVTYHPKRSPEAPRDLVAIVNLSAATDEPGYVERDTETATVTVGRDETHAKGGVELPHIGDRIQRADDPAPTDPGASLLAFTGKVLARTPHSYRLEFARPVPRVIHGQPRNP